MAAALSSELRADDAVTAHPEQYYDEVIQINLSELEPYINGPFTPDAACAVSEMKSRQAQERFPTCPGPLPWSGTPWTPA